MANDIFSALKTYLGKVSSGDKSPQELATALNHWAKESGEAIKTRIEEEVEKTVKRMGFAKKSDLDRLERDVIAMKKKLGMSQSTKDASAAKKAAKAAAAKKAPVKKTAKKAAKK